MNKNNELQIFEMVNIIERQALFKYKFRTICDFRGKEFSATIKYRGTK
jgi:hypothetical protein